MANLSIQIEPTKSKLQVAFNALKIATMPKAKYDVEDYTDNGNTVEVDYFATRGLDFFFDSATIAKVTLIEFIGDYCNNTVDTFYNGEHDQYEMSPAVYLEENMSEVLKDYLNNRNNG